MKPEKSWLDDWQLGVNQKRESAVAKELLNLFVDFWNKQNFDDKSKTTRYRYSNGLYALGNYIVAQSVSDDGLDKSLEDLLIPDVNAYEGPLVFQDNEHAQENFDCVCRKFYYFLKGKV